ncbi:hypothetical protein PG996_003086 [Apiospora saccharicola]|uniref:Uncharacterized protein n=1 Tax=Apiospora saccharicola TaxID=335842 RepID=A0ABR1W089_9PEZI
MYSTPSGSGTALASEDQPLLGSRPDDAEERDHEEDDQEDADAETEKYIGRFLPLAFIAALAMAATGTSTMIAYDRIACPDPMNCDPQHIMQYYHTTAAARTIGGVVGILSVGIARIWVESNPKLYLYLWLACRALGVGVVLLGFLLQNIYVAASCTIFDGLANGNVHYFVLAAVYVRTRVPGRFSRLLGTSLALYMLGYTISTVAVPFLLVPSFLLSFAVALVILGLSAAYLVVFIPSGVFAARDPDGDAALTTTTTTSTRRTIAKAIVDPVYHLYAESTIRLPALALLLHNTAQGFLFFAIAIHAIVDLEFGGNQYMILYGIESVVPAVYLMLALHGIPKLQRMWKRRSSTTDYTAVVSADETDGGGEMTRTTGPPATRDFVCIIICMLAQLIALPWFLAVSAEDRGVIYALVAVVSIGLSVPSFLKSYAVSIVVDDAHNKTSALGSLALMESIGSLVAPLLVPSFQFWIWRNSIVILAPSLVAASMLCLVASYFLAR